METYTVKITGEISEYQQRDEAISEFAKLFSITIEQADKMFKSAPVAIKKGIELDVADKFKEALIAIGVECIAISSARIEILDRTENKAINASVAKIEVEARSITEATFGEEMIEEEIIEIGKRTCIDLGIHGLHPQLTKMVGRMKYRSSYGQNLLQHSREVANLCATMAAELGLNPKVAKRAGLLHDIGKVPEDEPETPHAILGMKMAEKFGEKPDVCNAIGAHHDEIEMTTMIAPIVQVCDAISGSRPGARREIVESYIQRIKDLESLAMAYPGVQKSYAIQAGRELRVLVESENVSDARADELSFEISQKIQTEMTYPGQVKVTVIREKRAVAYAK